MARRCDSLAALAAAAIGFSFVTIAAAAFPLYVSNSGQGVNSTIGEYDTSGQSVNTALITGLGWADGLTLLNGNLYVADSQKGRVGEYSFSGSPVNPSLISLSGANDLLQDFTDQRYVVLSGEVGIHHFNSAGTDIGSTYSTIAFPDFFAEDSSSGNLLISSVNQNEIAAYSGAGNQLINRTFISGFAPGNFLVFGGDIYATDLTDNTVRQYNATSGALINANFITGLNTPIGIATDGSFLYISNDLASGYIGKYTLGGVAINTSFITGLNYPTSIAIFVPEPALSLIVAIPLILRRPQAVCRNRRSAK